MIERLNFYDVYGYLIPGLIFLALIWLPYGFVDGTFKGIDWSSAILGLVVSYILGHLIQGLAIVALPSARRGSRHPSDILLDDEDRTLSPEVKKRLVDQILAQFNIDVKAAGAQGDTLPRKRRQDAFFLCRTALVEKEVAAYAEQFEGMYALMRGVTAACIFGLVYYLGLLSRAAGRLLALDTYVVDLFWSAAIVTAPILITAIFILEISTPKNDRGQLFLFVAGLLYLLAGLVVPRGATWLESHWTLFSICLVLGFVALRCYGAYHEYSQRFAVTVYRDFCALQFSAPK